MRPHRLKVGNVCVDAMQNIAILDHKDPKGIWWGKTADGKPWKCANPTRIAASLKQFNRMISEQSNRAKAEIEASLPQERAEDENGSTLGLVEGRDTIRIGEVPSV